MKYSLDQQDLCQQTKRGCCQLKGAGRRRVGEGGHHAVNNIRHQTQQSKCSDQHEPSLPAEAHRPPWRTPLKLVLGGGKKERKKEESHDFSTQTHCGAITGKY